MAKAPTFKSGQKVPKSSEVEIIDPRGGQTGQKRNVVKGERFPPTPKPGQTYQIVDPTKH